MDIDATFKAIKKVYLLLNSKDDVEVSLTYKGTGFGVTKSWVARIDTRQAISEDHEAAVLQLLADLKKELESRAGSLEKQAKEFRKELNTLGN